MSCQVWVLISFRGLENQNFAHGERKFLILWNFNGGFFSFSFFSLLFTTGNAFWEGHGQSFQQEVKNQGNFPLKTFIHTIQVYHIYLTLSTCFSELLDTYIFHIRFNPNTSNTDTVSACWVIFVFVHNLSN